MASSLSITESRSSSTANETTAIDDSLLLSTLDDLSQPLTPKSVVSERRLEDLIDDLATLVCPLEPPEVSDKADSQSSQNNDATTERQRFKQCLDELSKPTTTTIRMDDLSDRKSSQDETSRATYHNIPLYLMNDAPNNNNNKNNNNSSSNNNINLVKCNPPPPCSELPCPPTSALTDSTILDQINFDFLKHPFFSSDHFEKTALDNLMKALLSKEALGEPMHMLVKSFGPWLQRFEQSNPATEELQRYKEQYKIYLSILQLCECTEEKHPSSDGKRTSADASNSTTDQQDPLQRLDKFQSLMEQLQHLGAPPDEVLNVLFESNDEEQTQQGETKGTTQQQRRRCPSVRPCTASEERNDLTRDEEDDPDARQSHSQKHPIDDTGNPLFSREMKSLLAHFEALMFGEGSDGTKREECRRSVTEQRCHEDCTQLPGGPAKTSFSSSLSTDTGEGEETMKDDVKAFLTFLGGLGLAGGESGCLLSPEILIKAATGEIREDEFVQMILQNETVASYSDQKETTEKVEANSNKL